jgi:DNA-binding transcriptional MerR regulator
MTTSRKSPARKTGRPADPNSRRAIAARLASGLGVNVTIAMVREWQGKGFPLDDIAALRRELETLQRPPGEEDGTEAGSLREQILRAELRRKLASADRLEQEAGKVRGELVEAAGIAAQAEGTGRAFRQLHDRMVNDLPPMLAGRTAGEIRKILHASFRELLNELADRPSDKFLKIP